MQIFLILFVAFIAAVAGYLLGMILTRRAGETALSEAREAALQAKIRLEAFEQAHTESFKTQAEALKAQTEALKAEFKNLSADAWRNESDALRKTHLAGLEALLKPLAKDIDTFRTQFVVSHTSLDHYMKELAARTDNLGREAENLAKALKGSSKLQGNWGEAILANLLEASGLTQGRDYTLQFHVSDGKGGTLIPDVVINLPDDRRLVIDSKVSLKAYADCVAAENDEERGKLLKEHVKSLRQHVRELSEKDYARVIGGSIGYVLMFVPVEGAYVAAVQADPAFVTDAYARHIIPVNPTNLLMALQLAYHLWQSEMRQRSVHEIYEEADKLYRKFTSFANNFVKIGHSLQQLQRTYEDAERQLHTGRGNIVSRLEGWKKKGLNPSAALPEELREE